MTLTSVLISNRQRPLRPLVRTALASEMRLLEVGIHLTERRLREFETVHQMTTKDFMGHFENDELDETLELAEWIGECRLLQRLNEKTEVLRDVR